jgi:hypothetical protein
MPLSKKATWGFVGESNRREINAKVKWLLQNTPDDDEARAMKAVLEKPRQVPDAIPAHMLPEGAVVAAVGGPSSSSADGENLHRKRHHRKGCPRHAQRVLARQQEALGEAVQAVAAGNPARALQLRRQIDDIGKATVSAKTATEEANLIGVAGLTMADKSGTATRLSRKERQLAALLAEAHPVHLLPSLHVPQAVGKGMAMFLTGGYTADPHMYDRRPNREHPNFGAVARVFDVERDSQFHGSPTPDPTASAEEQRRAVMAHTAPLAKRKLMALPVDKSTCRLKDDVKAHHELACTSAKSMMRGKR